MSNEAKASDATIKQFLAALKLKRDLRQARSEVDREVKVRERCYARWVDDGKITDVDATDRLDRLEDARTVLDALCDLQQADSMPV